MTMPDAERVKLHLEFAAWWATIEPSLRTTPGAMAAAFYAWQEKHTRLSQRITVLEGTAWLNRNSPASHNVDLQATKARANAEFMEAAPTDVPALTREVERLYNQQDSIGVLLALAGKRWMADHGECPLHGLQESAHRCRDYDGQVFGDGYASQGYERARKYLLSSETITSEQQ